MQHPKQGAFFFRSVLFKIVRINVILFSFFIFKHVDGSVSPPRSLTVVTEQMEQFSSHLGELCSFSVMQDRLAEQQKAAVGERALLKDIISRMHTQLREQERQLEKVRTELLLALARFFRVSSQQRWKTHKPVSVLQERWKATAEEAKQESVHRGLEEERRALVKEREELERAKVGMIGHTSSSECMCSVPLVTFFLTSLSASERSTGGADVTDGALCSREEKAGCRVGQLPQRREAETRAGGEGQQSAGEERERHHHSGKRQCLV